MAEARGCDEWNRTSALMALIASVNRDPKKSRAARPSDFNPFAQSNIPVKVGVKVLKDVFIDGKVPEEAAL
jgi:hypothetical protein